jgi:hypothetical protein
MVLAAGSVRAENDVIRDPPWRYWPSQADVNRDFPEKANAKNIPGRVSMRCVGSANGRLNDCMVLEETPVDLGFGDAALKTVARLVLDPKTSDGRPTAGATVEFTLSYYYDAYRTSKAQIFHPAWDATPTHEDMARAWSALPPDSPPGRVIFTCDFEKDGRLVNCVAASSIPADKRYETAARPLLEKFHITALPTPDPRHYRTAVPLGLHPPDPPAADPKKVRMISNARWVHTPTAQQREQAYPAKAAAAGVDQGRAGLECQINIAGMLTNCEVVGEDPKDLGFGEGALSVSRFMGITPWTNDGQPVEGAYVDVAVMLKREVKEVSRPHRP